MEFSLPVGGRLLSVEIGATLIGIAADRADVSAALADALAPYASAHEATHNFTLSISSEPDVFHRLVWNGCNAVRTLDTARLITALGRYLGGHAPPGAGVLRTSATPALREGRVYLLPPKVRRLAGYERQLRNRGFVYVDGPYADIDLATGTLVVADPDLDRDTVAGLEGLANLAPPSTRFQPPVPAGRYPIAVWVFGGYGSSSEPVSRADAVAFVLAPQNNAAPAPRLASDLARVFTRILPTWPPVDQEVAFAEWLLTLTTDEER